MRIFSFFILLSILISCNGTNTIVKNSENNYRYVSSHRWNGYKLSSYTLDNDTVLIVFEEKIFKKCSNQKNINFNKSELLEISNLKYKNDSVDFYYKMKTSNGLNIISGSAEPGNNVNQIYSYKSFPYLVTDCRQINN